MPGSVANANPTTTMPHTLCTSFAREQYFEMMESSYPNGDSQRKLLADTSRKSWRLGKRLTAAEVVELREFYLARRGSLEAFYFYDNFEAGADPEGETGRYTVRFEGEWIQSADMSRADVSLTLVEIA